MSDDLVKRLREGDEFTFDPTQSKVNIGPINDPICIGEEKPFGASVVQDIEAQLAEQIEWVKRLADDLIASEAKLAKAVEALEQIASHRKKCHEYDDDVGHERREFDVEDMIIMEYAARTTLEALKGQDDE